jgi:hypothetical protein
MSSIKQSIFSGLKIAGASAALFLLIDFFLGRNLLFWYTTSEERYRVPHTIFHHSLVPNFDAIGMWGDEQYRICTNSSGFKDNCKKSNQVINNADIVFIGDSFTEGIGLQFEDTFIGQISLARPALKVINMGVSSYSPSIYLAKIKYYVDRGLKFKEAIVYIDISDIQDEGLLYSYEDDIVINKNSSVLFHRLKIKLTQSLPLTHFIWKNIKALERNTSNGNSLAISPAEHEINYATRGEWTYSPNAMGFGPDGVDAAIDINIKRMDELHKFLKEKGIELSIGVYPWPNQILHDTAMSRQVVIWEEFCKNRCKYFYNSFDSFFALKDKMSGQEIVEKYFMAGDIHHNRRGAALLAQDFLRTSK